MSEGNPFEVYGLDPTAGPTAITERLRELAESTDDERERAAIREAWEALTMHPRRRLDLALAAHPETREAPGTKPRPPRLGASPDLTLADLVALPSLASLLGASEVPLEDVPLDEDPILAGSSVPPDP